MQCSSLGPGRKYYERTVNDSCPIDDMGRGQDWVALGISYLTRK